MLIRISGGSSGIAQYLTLGQMRGRFFERDELDKRIVLAGDLEYVDELIRGMEVSGGVERYNHITLSFREDFIDPATLLLPGHGPATRMDLELRRNPYLAG